MYWWLSFVAEMGYWRQRSKELIKELLQTMNQGLSTPMPPMPLAEELRRRELAAQATVPETGFDLRFGGLGENQVFQNDDCTHV